MLIVGLSLVFMAFFGFRNILLHRLLARETEAFGKRFNAELVVGDSWFTGLTTLRIDSLMLRPVDGDTLLTLAGITIEPSLMRLITGRLSPKRVAIDGLHLNLVRRDSVTNYMFLLASRQTDSTRSDTIRGTDYARLADRLAGLVFEKLPANLRLTGFRVMANLDGNRFVISTPTFSLDNHETDNRVFITNQGVTSAFTVSGRLDRTRREAGFSISPSDTLSMAIPYLDWKWNAQVSFDTLRFKMTFGELDNETTLITGSGLFSGLEIKQPMLSEKRVSFGRLEGDFTYRFGSDYIELDSASTFRLNQLTINPWARVYPRKPLKVSLGLHKPSFPAADLFGSLPEGLFLNLQGMRVSGNLSYDLRFNLDMACPDSLTFYSSLDDHDFKIVAYGATNLGLITGPFMHTAYERGQPARTFEVGPGNPNFRPYAAISPYLRNAIMTAEDGGFMWHRGFLPDAFRGAIIDNVKARRFVRGGSTISMQLVKNVFLNRNKTITRKLEEVLIVWLIENKRLCSKERMYEVYLNVIEMGPMVYGVQEGARFYFKKDASQLTLAESIFMASIVPHPKWFRYSFDEEGNLRDFLQPYFAFLASRMEGKGFITGSEAASLLPVVKLTGPARNFITPTDSISADSLRLVIPEMGGG